MKTTPSLPPRVLSRVPAAALVRTSLALLFLSCIPVAPVFAQSAEGFDASGLISPEAVAQDASVPAAPAKGEAAKNEAPVEHVPSRYAGTGPELAAYVERYAASFSIKSRSTDPFGRTQDPDAKVAAPAVLAQKKSPLYKPAPPTPFKDIVEAIEVNMVIPTKQSFLVGDRSFRRGDVFTIQLPTGKVIKVQVMLVNSSQIAFRNLETGESGVRALNITPAGMQRGNKGIVAPGMQPAGPNAPLMIQPSIPFSSQE